MKGMIMATKQIKSSAAQFAKGGSTKMHTGNAVGVSAPGSSAMTNSGNNKFGVPANTGKGHMFPRQTSEPAQPGVSTDTSHGDAGGNAFKVKGGSDKMFGYRPSNVQKPA
jgi:hypothetical protein